MGALDVTCKDYLKQPYVMTSLVQAVLFHDLHQIDKKDVQLIDTVEAKINESDHTYKDLILDVNSRITLHINDRDITFLFHVEPMSYVDTSMVIRIMGYDVNNIQTQCRNVISEMEQTGKAKDKKTCNYLTKLPHVLSLEPCISYVLNLSEQKWTGYDRIEDMYDPLFNELDIHPATVGNLKVIDPHTMSDEQLDLLIPELKFLFQAIRYQRAEYAEEMQALLDNSYLEIGSRMARLLNQILNIDIQIPKEGETVIVCGSMRVIKENIRAEGIQIGKTEGIEIGKIEGIEIGKFETALSFFRKGKLNASDAAEEVGMSVEQFLAKAKMN